MTKNGIFVVDKNDPNKGYEVWVNGNKIGTGRDRASAEELYKEQKRTAEAPAKSATPAEPSKAGKAAKATEGALKSAGKYIAGGIGGLLAGKLLGGGEKEGESRQAMPGKLTGWIFFALSLVIYYFIDWSTGYGGIDIGFFLKMGGIDWLFKSGVLTILLIIIIFQFTVARPKSPEEFRAALYLDIVLAVTFVIAKYNTGALIHFVFIVAIWRMLIKPVMDYASANRTVTVLILFDFLLFPALRYLWDSTNFIPVEVSLNYMIFPILSLYLLIYMNKYLGSKGASWLLLLVLLIYIFGFVRNSPQYTTLTAEIEEKEKEEAWGFLKTSTFRVGQFIGMFWDPISCSAFAGTMDYQACMKEQQYHRLCAEYGRGTEEYNNCIKQKQGLDVEGTIDKEREITKVELKKPTEFPKIIQKEFAPPIPMQLNIESPKKPITIELSCKFKTGSEEFEGEVQPKEVEAIIGEKQQTILCDMPSGKEYQEEKRYTVTYTAKIEGIETESTLIRFFIGEEDLEDNKQSSLLSLHGLRQGEASKSGEEFAVFSFGIGTPSTNYFMDERLNQVIIGNIENLANGKIVSVENIEFNLIDGVTPTSACQKAFTSSGNSLILKSEAQERLKNLKLTQKQKLPLLACNLNIAPNLAQTTDYLTRGFSSKITYTYEIEQRGEFTVAKSFTSV